MLFVMLDERARTFVTLYFKLGGRVPGLDVYSAQKVGQEMGLTAEELRELCNDQHVREAIDERTEEVMDTSLETMIKRLNRAAVVLRDAGDWEAYAKLTKDAARFAEKLEALKRPRRMAGSDEDAPEDGGGMFDDIVRQLETDEQKVTGGDS